MQKPPRRPERVETKHANSKPEAAKVKNMFPIPSDVLSVGKSFTTAAPMPNAVAKVTPVATVRMSVGNSSAKSRFMRGK